MSKLFTINVHYDFVVVANSVDDAYDVAMENVREALSDMPIREVEFDVTPGVSAVGWDDECIPYGGDGNTRTKDYK